jgi:hypothetical protein
VRGRGRRVEAILSRLIDSLRQSSKTKQRGRSNKSWKLLGQVGRVRVIASAIGARAPSAARILAFLWTLDRAHYIPHVEMPDAVARAQVSACRRELSVVLGLSRGNSGVGSANRRAA